MDIMILAERFFDYSRYMKGISPATIKRYKRAIEFYCKLAKVTLIEEVSESNLRQFFLHGRTVLKWQSSTYITYHKSLVVFIRWCVKEGFASVNFVEDIECPKLETKLPYKLTKQQSLRLLEVAYNYPYNYKFLRYRNHAIFAMCLYAGLRRKEILQIRFADIDIENLTIFISQGKGGKDRIIPMSTTLAQSLRLYLIERKRLNKTCPEFFTALNRNHGFSNQGIKRLVDTMRKASGLRFSLHKLRHTFATLMLEGGCDIYSISKMLGHSDIKTTTIYLSASAEHLRGQMSKHPLN
jgi:site-specific recombinase XerD